MGMFSFLHKEETPEQVEKINREYDLVILADKEKMSLKEKKEAIKLCKKKYKGFWREHMPKTKGGLSALRRFIS